MPLLGAVAAFGLARSGQLVPARGRSAWRWASPISSPTISALAMGNLGAYPPLRRRLGAVPAVRADRRRCAGAGPRNNGSERRAAAFRRHRAARQVRDQPRPDDWRRDSASSAAAPLTADDAPRPARDRAGPAADGGAHDSAGRPAPTARAASMAAGR